MQQSLVVVIERSWTKKEKRKDGLVGCDTYLV